MPANDVYEFVTMGLPKHSPIHNGRDAFCRLWLKCLNSHMIADPRSDRDTWRQQATRLLKDHRQNDDRKHKGLWKRLIG
jgi:hypothetical protein